MQGETLDAGRRRTSRFARPARSSPFIHRILVGGHWVSQPPSCAASTDSAGPQASAGSRQTRATDHANHTLIAPAHDRTGARAVAPFIAIGHGKESRTASNAERLPLIHVSTRTHGHERTNGQHETRPIQIPDHQSKSIARCRVLTQGKRQQATDEEAQSTRRHAVPKAQELKGPHRRPPRQAGQEPAPPRTPADRQPPPLSDLIDIDYPGIISSESDQVGHASLVVSLKSPAERGWVKYGAGLWKQTACKLLLGEDWR